MLNKDKSMGRSGTLPLEANRKVLKFLLQDEIEYLHWDMKFETGRHSFGTQIYLVYLDGQVRTENQPREIKFVTRIEIKRSSHGWFPEMITIKIEGKIHVVHFRYDEPIEAYRIIEGTMRAYDS